MPLTPGQVLNNRYRIVKLLGKGGFGAVYKAWDLQMNEPCAVKENLDNTRQAQFESEAKLLFKLRHQHLPAVHDHFIVPNQGQYLVMDFIEGEDLRQMVERSGPLPEERAIEWMLQVCTALQYMHTRQPPVIHRDIKPDNIKITPQGEAVLVDFGVAKTLVSGAKSSSIILTPGYAPLEQYGLAKTDARTDVYALGATLYTLLTGQPPVEAPLRPVRDPLISPRMLNPGLSQEVEQTILRAMQSDPEQRFQSAAELSAALQAGRAKGQAVVRTAPIAAGGSYASPTVTPQTKKAPTGGRRLSWGLILGLAALLAIAGWVATSLANRSRQQSTDRTATVVAALLEQLTPSPYPLSPTPLASFPFTRTPQPFTPTPRSPTPSPIVLTRKLTTILPTPTLGIGYTKVSPVDGMILFYVPAGEFTMGSADSDSYADTDEKPQHTVYLDAFWIDRTEVTNAQYALCVTAGKCQPPYEAESYTRSSYYGDAQFENYPVIKVSWEDAKSYCAWAGRRLPTEAEWEKAARGTDGRIYPWGSQQPTCQLVNYAGCVGDTSAVGSYPSGASPYGPLDMAGNVWEWVQDWYDGNYYANSPASNPPGPSSGQYRVLRGGDWSYTWLHVRTARRYNPAYPGLRADLLGFRCGASSGK